MTMPAPLKIKSADFHAAVSLPREIAKLRKAADQIKAAPDLPMTFEFMGFQGEPFRFSTEESINLPVLLLPKAVVLDHLDKRITAMQAEYDALGAGGPGRAAGRPVNVPITTTINATDLIEAIAQNVPMEDVQSFVQRLDAAMQDDFTLELARHLVKELRASSNPDDPFELADLE